MRETWVQSLGWEDPLEEGMATHSSILAWRIPMDRGAWRAIPHGVTKSQTRLSQEPQHSTGSEAGKSLLSSRREDPRGQAWPPGDCTPPPPQVKQNLLRVSYHIAQYTSIIADLRGEVQRLKRKVEERGGRSPDRAQLGRSDIRHIQGARVRLREPETSC